jgi:N-acetylglucosamine-6-phosphate deacetylase
LRTALTADVLYTPLETVRDPILLIEDGRIERVAARAEMEIPIGVRVEDFPGAALAPGLIDIHVHGGAGHDVMSATPDGFAAMGRLMAAHGVTGYCPTTVTAPLDATFAALARLADRIEAHHQPGARPLGIHLEGPFISHEKRGVHPPAHLQPPSVELFARMYEAARGHIALLTIAPELPGACAVIAEAVRRGVGVSLGHSNAELDAARAAIAAGAHHATHTFNAMRAFDHRDPGLLGAVLADDRLTADIIADGIHVHPAVIALFLRAKGPERAVLITDAISAAGMPDGRYRLGSFDVEVAAGKCLSDEGRLAGSVLTLDAAVRNVMAFAGWDLQSALRLATLNPAHVLGVAQPPSVVPKVPHICPPLANVGKGLLADGADADIIVLSPAGEVLRTIIGGAGL